MTENPRRKPYSGKMEYRAVQSDVEAMRKSGCSVKMIYDEMAKAGRLTIAYSTFCSYVCGGGELVHGRKKAVPKQPLNPGRPASVQSPVARKKYERPEDSSVYIREKTPLEDLI